MDAFKGLSILVEKKKRNLEKKKNKLDDLNARQSKGDILNEDQLKALTTYASVVYALENVKDLYDQSLQLTQEVEKVSKKQAKKQSKEKSVDSDSKDTESNSPSEDAQTSVETPAAIEPQPSGDARVDTSQLLIKSMILQYKIQEVLSDLGNEAVRECFSSGTHGAIKLSSAELEFLDSLYPHINPTRESLSAEAFEECILDAAKHCTYLFECREMEISEVGTTYDILYDLFSRIFASEFYVKGRHAEVIKDAPESSQTAAVVVNGGEIHSTVNPNAAEFYPSQRFQHSSQSSNNFNAEPIVYQNYQDNGEFYNYSQPANKANVNGPPFQPLSKVIEPLQSNFNFLQISEVDSSTTPTILSNTTSTEKVANAVMPQSAQPTAAATTTNTSPANQQSANNATPSYFDQSESTKYSDLAANSSAPASKPPGLTMMQPGDSSNATPSQPEPVLATTAQVESNPVSSWAQLLKKNVPASTGRVTAASVMQQAPPPAENLYHPYQKSSVNPTGGSGNNASGDDAGEDVFSKATDSQFLNKDNEGWISSSKPHHNRANKTRGAPNSKDNQPAGPPNNRNGFRGGRPGGRGGNVNTQFGGRGSNQGAARGSFSANLKQTWS